METVHWQHLNVQRTLAATYAVFIFQIQQITSDGPERPERKYLTELWTKYRAPLMVAKHALHACFNFLFYFMLLFSFIILN